MSESASEVSRKQAAHYQALFDKHGVSVDAVASARQEYKELRYSLLSDVFGQDKSFSLHEIGFGLGHYYEYLKTHFADRSINFSGSEVTPAFLQHCRERYPECEFDAHDYSARPSRKTYDYIVLAGVFYQLGASSPEQFAVFVRQTLSSAWKCVRRGLVFNMISSHVDYRYDHLFYGDPAETLVFISQNLSRFARLNQSTPLFEYKIYVYKKEYIKARFSDGCFTKYF